MQIRLILSYLFDWGIVLALLLITTILIPEHSVQFHQPFSLNNWTLQYPYEHKESIPYYLLAIICVVVPVAVILIWSLFIDGITYDRSKASKEGEAERFTYLGRTLSSRFHNIHLSLLGFALSLAVAIFVTYIFKITVGKPRPDVVDRCRPSYAAIVAQSSTGGSSSGSVGGGANAAIGLVNYSICRGWGVEGGSIILVDGVETSDARVFGNSTTARVEEFTYLKEVMPNDARAESMWEELLEDGWRSFPSLHTAISFAAFTYLTLFLACKLRFLAPIDDAGEGAGGEKRTTPNEEAESSRAAVVDEEQQQPSTSGSAQPITTPPAISNSGKKDQASFSIHSSSRGLTPLLFISICPLLAATVVGVTRITDNRCHPFDVVVGGMLGIACGWWGFRQYFPGVAIKEGGEKKRGEVYGIGARAHKGVEDGIELKDRRRGKQKADGPVEEGGVAVGNSNNGTV